MKRIPEFLLALSWFAAGVSIAADPPRQPAPEPAVTLPVVTLPERLSAEPREWVIVSFKVSSSAGTPKFYLPDQGLSRVGLETLFGDEAASKAKGIVVRADQPGTYRVVGYCGSTSGAVSDPAVCVITIGQPSPVPPTPSPTPPGPTPGPIPPTDPLFLSLATAFNQETLPDRARVPALASLYRTAATTTVYDAGIATNTALWTEMRKAAELLLKGPAEGAGAVLPKIRRAIADDLNARMNRTPNTALSKTDRDQWAQEFGLIASRLEALK
jgi:hypothetical protein